MIAAKSKVSVTVSSRPKVLMAFIILSCAFGPLLAEDRITTRQTGEHDYELTFESTTVFDVTAAQRLLIPTVRSICGQRYVKAGRYTYDSDERITSESGDEDPSKFKLVQEIRCVDEPPASSQPARDQILTDADALRDVESKIRELSTTYFESFYSHLGNDAEAAINALAGNRPPSEGLKRAVPQPTAPGTALDINIHTITIYDNTPSAPAAGVYVAADYQNSVGNVAFHCGYLMWYSEDGEEFSLGRVESGVISEKLLATISGENLQTVLNQLRCSMK